MSYTTNPEVFTFIMKVNKSNSNPPTAQQIEVGELAINLVNHKIYTKTHTGQIVELGKTITIPTFKNVELNPNTNVLTFTRTDNSVKEINLSKFDNNDSIIVSGDYNDRTKTLILTKANNDTINIDLSSLTSEGGGGVEITSIEFNNNTLTFNFSDGSAKTVDLSPLDNSRDLIVSGNYTPENNGLTLLKANGDAITIDLSQLTSIDSINLNGTTLEIILSNGTTKSVDLASIDTKDAETIKAKSIDPLPTESKVLMYNPNTDKFEFTALPTCEQGNIIVPTYTRVDNTPFALEDIEQLITNRITKVNAEQSTPYEPLRYICLEPTSIVPINKGVLQNYREFDLSNARMRLNTNGDILFYLNPVANTISKYDFDLNLIETIELNDDIYNGSKITAVSKNGKRVFTSSGIYDYNQSTNKYERVSDKQFQRDYYGQYRCNSCANIIIDDYADKVYRLVDGGTWEEISTKTSNDNYNFSDYGFGKVVWRKSSTELAIGEFDENFNLVEEESFDTGETTADYPAISGDLKIVAVATTSYKLLLFVKDINTNTFILQGKIITSFFVYDLIFSRNQNKLFIIGDNKVATVDIMMTPSMYCGQEKTYTLDETLDLTQGNIALNSVNSFCRDKRNAADSNARTFFINDNEANTGDIFLIDLINDSKQIVLNAGNSVKYMIQRGNYLFLHLYDDTMKYYDISDLSNPVEISVPALNQYELLYLMNSKILDNGDVVLSTFYDTQNKLRYYSLDVDNNTLVYNDSLSLDVPARGQRKYDDTVVCASINNRVDENSGEYISTLINLFEGTQFKTTIEIVLGQGNISGFKILGDMLVVAGEVQNDDYDTIGYMLGFICIEDLNNPKIIATTDVVYDINTSREQIFMLFNEYQKSQKTIFKYKDNSTLETFSLLV